MSYCPVHVCCGNVFIEAFPSNEYITLLLLLLLLLLIIVVLLSHSLMELSPSSGAANCAATQEHPSILWNPLFLLLLNRDSSFGVGTRPRDGWLRNLDWFPCRVRNFYFIHSSHAVCGRGLKLTIHLHLMARLRVVELYPHFSYASSCDCA
jgi:hypothetical protein